MKSNDWFSDTKLEDLLRGKLRDDLVYYVEFFRRIIDEELCKILPDDTGSGLSGFLASPGEYSRGRGRPPKISPEIDKKIRSNYRRIYKQCQNIFSIANMLKRESQIRKIFPDVGESIINNHPALVSAEALRDAVLAERFGVTVRAIQEYLRNEQRSIRAMELLDHPGVSELTITGRGKNTKIVASVKESTPEVMEAVKRFRAVAKIDDRKRE